MTFIAAGFMELIPGYVQRAVKIVREGAAGFYEVTLANGGVLHHVAGKYLTFGTFSDDRTAPKHDYRAKTYPARHSGAQNRTQRPYEQLTLW